jgi:multicomponent K+:H+ antiporter subunit G
MNALPVWVAALAALLLVLAGCVTLIGSFGLLRLRSFHERMHAPTLGTTLGTFCVVLACTLVASFAQHRPVLHEWLICLLLILTTPVTAILLMRGAIQRRQEAAPPPHPNAAE